MAAITLDFIREAADKKFGHLTIELDSETSVVLTNPIRLSAEKRKAFLDNQKQMEAEKDEDGNAVDTENFDQAAVLEESLRIVADSKPGAERLIEALGGDLAQLISVFESYTKGVELGEASPSQD